MISDPNLGAVRAARLAISREFGNDPGRLLEHYQELQAKHDGKKLSGPKAPSVQNDDGTPGDPAAQ